MSGDSSWPPVARGVCMTTISFRHGNSLGFVPAQLVQPASGVKTTPSRLDYVDEMWRIISTWEERC
jgi:hypothetical protein